MIFNFEERQPDSPYVEAVWRNHCESGGPFISMALGHWGMVITKLNGKTSLTVRGPETRATPAYCPPGAEHFGVYFKLGTFMHHLPAGDLRDGAVTLPEATSYSFWLNGSAWQYPDYENFDVFVDRLVRAGLLVREPVVDAALRGDLKDVSIRTVQRRFLRATGLTHGAVSQIDRARYATILLKQGVSILDTVYEAGYADQPHLTRSLKYYIGQTPTQLTRKSEQSEPAQLSFLFKTTPFA
jgi:AraC-like DNA-binding protein